METINAESYLQAQESSLSDSYSSTEHVGLGTDLLANNVQSSIQYDKVLFIDSAVEDYQNLIDNLSEPAEVVILDSQQDGIVQITNYLGKYDDFSAVHIVSHGDAGQLFLGNTELNQATLPQYQDLLSDWGDSMAENGDILLYGCDVAADLAGASFVRDLSQYTQADILASTDETGSDQLGGDWDLEYATGNIEAEIIFEAEVQNSYEYTLVGSITPSVESAIDYIALDGFDVPGYSPIETIHYDVISGLPLNDVEAAPFSLGLDDPFGLLKFNPNYEFNNPKTNSLVFGFNVDNFDFNHFNFDFNSVSSNEESITFGFETGAFDFGSAIPNDSIKFSFKNSVDYDSAVEKVDLDSMLSFDATTVTFTPSSVTFEYNPDSLSFDFGLFESNSHLFNYKFLDDAEFSFTKSDVDFYENFSASDYRALEYSFAGDEIFSSEYYLAQGVIPDGMNPFTDYYENGYSAGKDPHPFFNTSYYNQQNPDVVAHGVEPMYHFATIGHTENHENRDPHPLFDTSYYNQQNPDVVEQGAISFTHYFTIGRTEDHENRDPNPLFDTSYYRLNNPDVVAHGMPVAIHYDQHGWRESYRDNPENFNPNRNPNAFFNTSHYFEIYEDVRIASFLTDDADPVQHMLEHGISENRITHKLFQSDNLVEIKQKITADSEYFPIVKQEIRRRNYDIEANEDGTIKLSRGITFVDESGRFNIFEPIENALEALTISVITGITVSALNTRDFISDLADDITWELIFDSFGTANVGDALTISGFTAIPPIHTGTPPFESPEPTRTIEIFVPENINGTEDITFIPLDDFVLPANPTLPEGKNLIEELVGGGLFVGGETIPLGTYVYASNGRGGFFGYDPTELSNASDWNNRITQNGTVDVRGFELPYRIPNSVKDQLRAQATSEAARKAIINEPTHGLFYPDPTQRGGIRLRSRSNSTSDIYREQLFMREGIIRKEVDETLRHVEGNAATIMRDLGIAEGTVFINHEEGPCDFCGGTKTRLSGIEQILLQGQTLTVIYNDVNGKSQTREFKGKALK